MTSVSKYILFFALFVSVAHAAIHAADGKPPIKVDADVIPPKSAAAQTQPTDASSQCIINIAERSYKNGLESLISGSKILSDKFGADKFQATTLAETKKIGAMVFGAPQPPELRTARAIIIKNILGDKTKDLDIVAINEALGHYWATSQDGCIDQIEKVAVTQYDEDVIPALISPDTTATDVDDYSARHKSEALAATGNALMINRITAAARADYLSREFPAAIAIGVKKGVIKKADQDRLLTLAEKLKAAEIDLINSIDQKAFGRSDVFQLEGWAGMMEMYMSPPKK